MEVGFTPVVGLVAAAVKGPSPLPSSTVTELLPEFATARSRLPSLLKSPATMEVGFTPRCRTCLRLRKGPVSVAQQYGHGVAAIIRYGQVGNAVSVEVSRHNRIRSTAGSRAIFCFRKRSIPLPSNTVTVFATFVCNS